MKRALFFSIFLLISCSPGFGQIPLQSPYAFVYALSDADLVKIAERKLRFDDFILGHLPQDSAASVDEAVKRTGNGNFLVVFPSGASIACKVLSKTSYKVIPSRQNNAYFFSVIAADGSEITDARIDAGGKPVTYDPVLKMYRLHPQHTGKLVTVHAGNEFSLHRVSKDAYRETESDRIPGAQKRRWRRNRRILRYSGYSVSDKGSYLPEDTLKAKLYLAYKSGRRCRFPVIASLRSDDSKIMQTDTLFPVRPGCYLFDKALRDSFPPGHRYEVYFYKKSDRYLPFPLSFEVKDYQLQLVKYTARLASGELRNQDSIRLYLSATDANGLPMMDARVDIRLEFLSYRFGGNDTAFVPDSIYKKSIPLDQLGETAVRIPTHRLPQEGVMDLRMAIHFSNASGEIFDTLLLLNVTREKEYILFEDRDSVISARYFSGGKELPAEGFLRHTNDSVRIALPAMLPVNGAFGNFTIEAGELFRMYSYDANAPKLTAKVVRTADSVFVRVSNPRSLPFTYVLHRNRKQVLSGHAKAFSLARQDHSDASYHLEVNYAWAGKYLQQNFYDRPHKNKLLLDVTMPDKIFPGERVEMKVKVTDLKNRPVKNADLTAFGINMQAPVAPDVRVPQKRLSYKLPKKKFAFSEVPAIAITENKIRIRRNLAEQLNLDTMAVYRLMFPGETGITRIWLPTRDSATAQLNVSVTKGDTACPVLAVYLDSKLVSFSGANALDPLSIRNRAGTFRLEVRIPEGTVTMDSLVLEAGKKLEIAIDFRKARNVRFEKRPVKMTQAEITLLGNSLFQLHNSQYLGMNCFATDALERIFRLPTGYNGDYIFGPLAPGGKVSVYQNRKLLRAVTFEPGFRYILVSENIKLYDHALFKEKNSWTDYVRNTNDVRYGEIMPTLRELTEEKTRFRAKLSEDLNFTGRGTAHARIAMVLDSAVTYMAIRRVDDPYNVLTFEAYSRSLEGLAPGKYAIAVYSQSLKFVVEDTFDIVEGGTMHKRISGKKFLPVVTSLLTPTTGAAPGSLYFHNSIRWFGEAQLSGIVKDSTGVPVFGAAVTLQDGGNVLRGMRTGKDGKFTLRNLRRGYYKLNVSAPGLPSYSITKYISSGTNADEELFLGEPKKKKQHVSAGDNGNNSWPSIMPDVHVVDVRRETEVMSEPLRMEVYSSGNRELNEVFVDGISIRGFVDMEVLVTDSVRGLLKLIPGVSGTLDDATDAKALRTDFRDNAYWIPDAVTDANGMATLTMTFPDNLTQWQNYLLAVDTRLRSGSYVSRTKAFKPLAATLLTPRFMVTGDSAVAIGKIMNYLGEPVTIEQVSGINGTEISRSSASLDMQRIDDFPFSAAAEDSVKLSYTLRADGYGDGEERVIPVFPAGVMETKGFFAVIENDTTIAFRVDTLPQGYALTLLQQPLKLLEEDLLRMIAYEYNCHEQISSKLLGHATLMQLRGENKTNYRDRKKVDALLKMLREGINTDGSYGWWPGGKTSLYITAYVVRAIDRLNMLGYAETFHEKARGYLVRQAPSLNAETLMPLIPAFENFRNTIDIKPQLLKAKDSLYTNSQKLMLLRAKKYAGESITVADVMQYATTTATGEVSFGRDDHRNWQDNSVTATVIAYRLLQAIDSTDANLEKIRRYLLMRRTGTGWNNISETAAIVPILLESESIGSSGPGSVTVNGREVNGFPLVIHAAKEAVNGMIEVKRTGGMPLYLSGYYEVMNTGPEPVTASFKVTTALMGKSGSVLPLSGGMQPGTVTNLVVSVEAYATENFVMIEIPVPAGCFYAKGTLKNRHEVYRETYKQKTVIFCEQLPKGKHEFVIALEPRFAGNYTLNPAKAELMYFPVFYGREGMKKVRIKK